MCEPGHLTSDDLKKPQSSRPGAFRELSKSDRNDPYPLNCAREGCLQGRDGRKSQARLARSGYLARV